MSDPELTGETDAQINQGPAPVALPVALPPGMKRKTVGTKELAEVLDCDPRTLIKAVKAGKIPAFRIRREFRFDPAAVRIALSNNVQSRE